MADIELLIKIDEEIHQAIKTGNSQNYKVRNIAMVAIENGTQLPKGHGRLVDVDEYFNNFFNDAREFLDMAQTIVPADREE